MILMAYLPGFDLYVPMFWILLQGKSEIEYNYALQQAISSTDWKLDAISTSCDFERSLMNAVNAQFKGSTHIGNIYNLHIIFII